MEIKTIAIVGAAGLGRRLAYAAVLAGYRTILEDISPSALEQGIAWIAKAFRDDVVSGKRNAASRDTALANLGTAIAAEDAAREADLIIEAVPDEMEMKIELFTIFDKFAKPGAILASNTSSLSITEIASITFRAEDCIGMHFLDPVAETKLLEIVRALETSEATLQTCVEVGRRMGKEVVVIRESPGFVTGRI